MKQHKHNYWKFLRAHLGKVFVYFFSESCIFVLLLLVELMSDCLNLKKKKSQLKVQQLDIVKLKNVSKDGT